VAHLKSLGVVTFSTFVPPDCITHAFASAAFAACDVADAPDLTPMPEQPHIVPARMMNNDLPMKFLMMNTRPFHSVETGLLIRFAETPA
jgi:hypothetical protein